MISNRGRFVKPIVENPDENNTDNFITAYVEEMRKRNDSGKPTTMDCKSIFKRSLVFLDIELCVGFLKHNFFFNNTTIYALEH